MDAIFEQYHLQTVDDPVSFGVRGSTTKPAVSLGFSPSCWEIQPTSQRFACSLTMNLPVPARSSITTPWPCVWLKTVTIAPIWQLPAMVQRPSAVDTIESASGGGRGS